MGFHFGKSFRLGKYARLNVSKNGIDASVGRKGLRLVIGKRGLHVTTGVPGTGLNYTKNFSRKKSARKKHSR